MPSSRSGGDVVGSLGSLVAGSILGALFALVAARRQRRRQREAFDESLDELAAALTTSARDAMSGLAENLRSEAAVDQFPRHFIPGDLQPCQGNGTCASS